MNKKSAGTHFILAPIAGVTDAVFRKICAERGAAFAYTEMVSAKALTYKDARTYELLRRYPGEKNTGVQLFGSEPDIIARAIGLLPEGFASIDINMGCPAKKITQNGEGGALMKNVALAAALVRAAVREAGVPVTAKMRLGWDNNMAIDFARTLEDAGAAAVTVHGRTVSQQYGGKADWDAIAEVKRALSIPVIANGDALSPEKANALLKHTGCEGVMIARGALGNPWIFEGANALFRCEAPREIPQAERLETAKAHLFAACEYYGESRAPLILRKHLAWYTKGMKNSAAMRVAFNACVTAGEMVEIIDNCKTNKEHSDIIE